MIVGAYGLITGWDRSPALLVLSVLTFGGLAVVTSWELVMRVDNPPPREPKQ